MNEILVFAAFFAAGMVMLIIIAAAVKLKEVQKAKTWLNTRGKVIRSEVRAVKKRQTKGPEKVRSAPFIVYEYTVNGKRYQGERISLAEIIPESDIEGLLNRYPVGAEVPVWYDPSNPQQAVLHRDLPPDFGKELAGVFAFLGGGAVLALLTLAQVPELLAPHLPNPQNAQFVTLAAGLGLFLLLFGFVQQRQALAMQTWPSTPGMVVSSEIRSFKSWSIRLSAETTFYTPGIVYRYTVGGREYTADRYSLGGEFAWGSANLDLVKKTLQRFPVDSSVTVYYNPKSPAESVLERRITGGWLIWTLAIGLLALAVVGVGIL